MFFDRFEALCKAKGIKPGRACIDMGLSRSLAAKWKATKTEKPSADALEKMSAYFGISIEKILSGEDTTEQPSEDPELDDILEQLKNRSEMRMLFKLATNATKEDVLQAVRIIEAIRKKED